MKAMIMDLCTFEEWMDAAWLCKQLKYRSVSGY